VGKTSLVAALEGKPFEENRPTTHGIEVRRIALVHPSEGVSMDVNVWDFGGQEVYRVTHQCFYSGRTLYLIVWRPREGREQNEVEGWIRRLRLRVGNDA